MQPLGPLEQMRHLRNFLDSLEAHYQAGDSGVAERINAIYRATFSAAMHETLMADARRAGQEYNRGPTD